MIEKIAELTDLSTQHLVIVCIAVLAAGMVRGFAGFALSAILMASVVVIIPPVELIPICFMLEAAASIAMFRGGLKEADMNIVWGLAIGSAIGVPIGLLATTTIDAEISKLIALLVILSLTFAQLLRMRPKFLASKPGLYGSGLAAGVVTGLASVGGMVVALYVLSSNAEPKKIRASLVMFLFMGMFTSFAYLWLYEMMDAQALWRAVVFVPIVLSGVVIGSLFFRPSLVHLYKRVCLWLLISLCVVGLIQQSL